MPGIVGIIGPGNPKESAIEHQQMLTCLLHEPFYVSGNYVNERLGLWLGWVAHEHSFSDCNPIWNETKDICLIFTGEDFTDAAEINNLKRKGHEFNSENAGYLVHWYEEMGLDFIGRLNGCFSGVLVDLRKESAVLFNDRFGLSRIYYHEHKGSLYFSSEAKSLLKVFPKLRQLDPQSVAETFSCGCVLQDRTLFSGISLLPSGSRWESNATGTISKHRYFKPDTWEAKPLLSEQEFYQQLKATFANLLPRYFKGSQQVAMSLTGGLDGRMMMAWEKRAPGELPCYTFGSSYRDCSDVRIARKVAKVCQQSHKTIEVGRDFFAQFPSLAEKSVYLSDGTMDVIGSVELYVNKIARQIAPVRLTGNYGSEIVRGNVAFKANFRNESALQPEFAQWVKEAAATYHAERQCHWLTFIAFKQVPWHHYSRLSVEQSQLTLRSPYLDNDLIALMYQAPSYEFVLNKEASLRLIMEGNADLAKIPTDRGLLYKPTPVLGKLRHLFDEFTVKAEYAYDYGMPQRVAQIDHIFAPLHLERLFLGRHKFYHFRVWYRDQLAEYVKSVLLDTKTLERSFFRKALLEEMVNAHVKGNRNYTLEIHRALTLELLQRQLDQM
jgi:asparagine synthase (glutamine-hydrolysing)